DPSRGVIYHPPRARRLGGGWLFLRGHRGHERRAIRQAQPVARPFVKWPCGSQAASERPRRRTDVMDHTLEERILAGPDGTRFAYVDLGQGRPLVLLHGWSSSLRWFNRNLADLATDHRVVAPDFRGHGSSEKTASGHTMEQYARDVRDFIEGIGARDCILVGWSMGSLVLWNYVMQFGAGQARGMVFVGQSASDLITPDYEHGILS